jgi:hypothetical protein
MRRTATPLAVAALVLLGAPAADGEPTLVTNVHPLSSADGQLATAGPTTLVAGSERPAGESEVNVVRSFAAGHPPAVLARVELKPDNPEGFSDSQTFAASSTRIVVLVDGSGAIYKGTGRAVYVRLEAGLLGAPLQQLPGECPLSQTQFEGYEEQGFPWSHSAVALDGEVVAYDSYDCLFVADLAAGGPQRVIALGAPLDPIRRELFAKKYLRLTGWETRLRVAGRLVAYRANPTGAGGGAAVVVYDIDTGRALYSVPLPAESELGGFAIGPSFDVQSDGTLVIADALRCTASVSTIARPLPRPLGIPACAVRGLRGGRVLLVVPGPGQDRLLAWSPLESPSAHVIADVGRFGTLEATPAETDGASVAYAIAGCEAPSIYRAPLSEPGTPPTAPSRCPVRVDGHATLTAKGLSVHLRCPLGCEGSVESRFGTRRQLSRGRGRALGERLSAFYSLAPGRAKALTLLSAEYAATVERTLVRDRSRVVKLELTTQTPASNSPLLREGEDAHKLGVVAEQRTHLIIPIDVRLHTRR